MKDFLKRIDALFVGRKTFEMMGGKGFGKKKQYVFSNTLKIGRGNGNCERRHRRASEENQNDGR